MAPQAAAHAAPSRKRSVNTSPSRTRALPRGASRLGQSVYGCLGCGSAALFSAAKMQLHGTGTDYGVYKATFGNMTVAITIPNEDTLPSMEQFTEALETFRSIQHRYLAKLSNMFLHCIKAKQIIHSDLKPSNILFDSDNLCKLSDFGISSLLHPTNHVSLLEKVAWKLVDIDACTIQTDISALGTILLKLVTGHPDAEGVRDFVVEKLRDAGGLLQEESIKQQKDVLRKVVDPELKMYPEGAVAMF
ncbi:hypothetical protein ABZP36_005462 [Zizania latifolia]